MWYNYPMTQVPHDSSSDDELVFSTHGTAIDDAYENDDDVDEVEEDDYSEDDYE
jgi:hypothetical protein